VISKNAEIINKIKKTGNNGPVMALVGQVMKLLNRRGDPTVIRNLIMEAILK